MIPIHAIILAAGIGSRLQPLTNDCPKCLLKLGLQTILERTLQIFIAQSLKNVIIVTGYLHSQIASYVHNRFPSLTLSLCFNSQYEQTGNAASLATALLQEKNIPSFVLLDGDLVFHPSILKNLISHRAESVIMVDKKPTRLTEEAMKVRLDQKKHVVQLTKKMPLKAACGESIGMARFGNAWTEKLKSELHVMSPHETKKAYYEDIFNRLMPHLPPLETQSVNGHPWCEVDTLEDYQEANRIFSSRKQNMKIINSHKMA